MRQTIIIMFILCIAILMGGQVFAEKNIFVELKVPDVTSVNNPDARSFFIQSVTDKRFFGGLSSPVDVPSWGIDDPKEQTDALKHRAVGRAVLRGGKGEGNVLIGRGDVKSIIGDIIRGALTQLGHSVIEGEDEIKPETIVVEVEINNFWGFFQEAFIGGNINAHIETSILLKKKDKREKKTLRVSGKMSARYPQKPENWERVFNSAIEDLMKSALAELRQ